MKNLLISDIFYICIKKNALYKLITKKNESKKI